MSFVRISVQNTKLFFWGGEKEVVLDILAIIKKTINVNEESVVKQKMVFKVMSHRVQKLHREKKRKKSYYSLIKNFINLDFKKA